MEHLTDSQLTDLLSGAATPDLASHIDAHIDQLEKRRGEKFPTLQGELPPGRRVGT